MDFLDPKKRRAHQVRLYIGYGLMALLVGMVAILMLFQAYGYSYNFRTGNISQNGLLFVNSNPVASTLTLNGEVKGQTDQRLTLPAGSYTMQLNTDGYREWRRDVVLGGGEIERFVYPFLFPVELVTSSVQLLSERPEFITQSPDRQWLLVQVPGSYTQFDRFDLAQEQPIPVRLTLPDSLLTAAAGAHKLSLIEWSTDNRHVIIQHDFAGGNELILVDTAEPELSKNLNKQISTSFTTLKLRDKKFDSYYLHNKELQTLQRFDLESGQLTTLHTNVLAFQPHGDDELLMVTSDSEEEGLVNVKMVDSGTAYTVKTLVAGEKYLLDIARFDDKWYLAMGSTSDQKVYVLRNPTAFLSSNPPKKVIPASVLRLEDGEFLSFSQNTRFLMVQSGAKFTVYDAEEDRNYLYDTELNIPRGQKFTWMDGHRLTSVVDGKHVVFDYDGTNRQLLSAGYSGSQPYFDRDYTAAYTIAPAENIDGRTVLMRTELVAE